MLEHEIQRAHTLEAALKDFLFRSMYAEQIDALCALLMLRHRAHLALDVQGLTRRDISDERMRADLSEAIAQAETMIGA